MVYFGILDKLGAGFHRKAKGVVGTVGILLFGDETTSMGFGCGGQVPLDSEARAPQDSADHQSLGSQQVSSRASSGWS